LFYEFKRSKNFSGGAASQGVILHDKKRLSANRGAATTGSYFSELPGREYSGGAYNITDIFYTRNFDALVESGLLEFKVPMVCLATACVSLRRD
jgi:hypothetical protein